MEIKYTLEILTKDIQDIGKLVENLRNSPEGSTLELDLALSKLRHVYELLTVIRTDLPIPAKQPWQTPEVSAPPQAEPEPVVEPAKPEPEPEPAVEPAKPEPEPIAKKGPEIIAEKFPAESSINENLAGNREPDLDTKLIGQPIDNIGRNIGINDRFLIIRELFDGDSDGFGKLIRDLDSAGDLQSASDRLQMQFENSPDHEGVAILENLVKRRYSKS